MAKAFHLSINVSDINKSVAFFSGMFGAKPTKHYEDYAKFDLEDPALVLSLEKNGTPGLNHLGVKLSNKSELIAFATELMERGLNFDNLDGVECCYSRQTKVFMHDPDNHLCEVYIVDADIEPTQSQSKNTASRAEISEAGGSFDHMLPSAFPTHIDCNDGTLEQINLRGTLNASLSSDEVKQIFLEAKRALKTNGILMAHMLVADKTLAVEVPQLPEPASHVRSVPPLSDVITWFEEFGFRALATERLSHAPVFSIAGVGFRELLIKARKPSVHANEQKINVYYKGPFPEITDDFGNSYKRGVVTEISGNAVEMIRKAGYGDHFVMVEQLPQGQAAGCAAHNAG